MPVDRQIVTFQNLEHSVACREANDWIRRNPDVEIIETSVGVAQHYYASKSTTTIAIWYKEKTNP